MALRYLKLRLPTIQGRKKEIENTIQSMLNNHALNMNKTSFF